MVAPSKNLLVGQFQQLHTEYVLDQLFHHGTHLRGLQG